MTSYAGIESPITLLSNLVIFSEDLPDYVKYWQPRLIRLDSTKMCSVFGSHIVNKNQDGVTKFHRFIKHHSHDGSGGRVRVTDLFNCALILVDLGFEAMLNVRLDTRCDPIIVTVPFPYTP
jgi:hypothetical protein